ncbi:MAG: foldase protein PrsA [Bacteroidota bacterium]
MNRFFITILSVLLLNVCFVYAQSEQESVVVDKVVAVVGRNIVKLSDVESQFYQAMSQGAVGKSADLKCDVFEELLTQKLLINQARIDSLEITEAEVEMMLESRLDFFINQIGSRDKLEAYFNKSIIEIKEDMRDPIREQILADRMQGEIVGDIKLTPSEVRSYFNSLPKDSIPEVDATVQLRQIAIYPPDSEEAIFEVRERLLDLRQRILNGENFATLAVLYSEDPSAVQGGELGFMGKGSLDPEYAKAAFALKKGGVSKIVESDFGYHIIQLIDRQDDRVNTRHILMKPKVSAEALEKARARLDSIAELIHNDSLSFEYAAAYFSEDEDSRLAGGQMINNNPDQANQYAGTPKFKMEHLAPEVFQVVREMEVGQITEPIETVDRTGKKVYKIFMLEDRTDPHLANLDQDYNLIKNMAMGTKREEVIGEWIEDKIKTTYISIDNSFANCNFTIDGWYKQD